VTCSKVLPREMGRPCRLNGGDRGQKMVWNYKPTGRRVRGRTRRRWKEDFEAGTGITLPNPRRIPCEGKIS
jgi:hypothetical protein